VNTVCMFFVCATERMPFRLSLKRRETAARVRRVLKYTHQPWSSPREEGLRINWDDPRNPAASLADQTFWRRAVKKKHTVSFPARDLNVYLNYYVHMQNHAAPPPQAAHAHSPANSLFSDFNPAPNMYADTVVKAGGFEFLAQLYQDERLFELRDHRLPTSARAVRATTCLCVNTTKLVLSLCPLFPEGSKD